jgi:hypothetical protein
MFSLKESILGKKLLEKELKDIEPMDVEIESEEDEEQEDEIEEPSEEPSEESTEEHVEQTREILIEEIHEALEDLTDDELDVVLDAIYSILLAEEDEEGLKEALIDHQTPKEKTTMKLKRRLPKWKRKAKIRYFRNKKCPTGTSWSSVTKSCTHINIDMSRLQKIIAKMKIRSK